jgi:exodeoxyribonuclease VIII
MENKVLMSNKDYHAAEGIGSTLLKGISSKTIIHALENPFEETDASILGGALHCHVLTPETFESEYIVSPNCDRRTKAGKDIYSSFLAMAEGRQVISQDDFDTIKGMTSALLEHESASYMLKGGEAEFSYFTKCPKTEMTLKCRPDYVNKNTLIDIKTARDASYSGFSKACGNFFYHLQAAFYLDVYNMATGSNLKEFYFVVVENTAPFAVATYKLDELAIEHGRVLYTRALERLAEYRNEEKQGTVKKQKYMYGEGILTLCLPTWAY